TQMLQEAVGHLREAVNLHPDYKNAWLLLGNAFNYLKQYEESIAGYKHALDIDPGYQEAINNLGITYRDAGKFYGEVQHDLAKSIGYLEEAYKLRPDEYETVRLLGVAYGIGNNPRKAVEYFGIATKLQPQNADAWFNLGLAWHSAGDAAQGDAYIQKAKELDPTILDKRGEREGGRE
ncbi:MAG: tetratricopeptide repeat protein, partial [Lewinellaceae bacterium]|nr:tetratricopeptide repeat protein [Lewinellaceae bacterium]